MRKCYLKLILDNPNCELEELDFIESVEIEIGGKIISTYEKDFLHIILENTLKMQVRLREYCK